jgi:hypothetical protein
MARFFINEREIAPPLDISSLDQILKHVEDIHLPPNSLIRQIYVDGLSLMPDAFSRDPDGILQQMESRDKVEILTGTLWEIAHDSIIEAMAYLERIEAITPSLAASFQNSPGPGSFENLRQLYEGFYWLNLLLGKLETNFQMNFEKVFVQEMPVREHFEKFIAILKQLMDSQRRGDFALIGDLLEYEMLPLVPIWKEIFRCILQKVGVPQ